jgi:hypothetical protein
MSYPFVICLRFDFLCKQLNSKRRRRRREEETLVIDSVNFTRKKERKKERKRDRERRGSFESFFLAACSDMVITLYAA